MKRLKNLDYLLSFGMFILLFASLSLVFNNNFKSGLTKFVIILCVALVYFILSGIFKKILKTDFSNKVAYALGCLNLINSLVVVGMFKVFGYFFSFTGDGVLIFLSSIAILIGILAVLTVILYKNYRFIHIAYAAVMFMIIFLLVYFKVNYFILMIIVNVILLILSFISKFKESYEFSNVAIYISSVVNIFIFNESELLLSSLLFLLSVISLIKVSINKKVLEYELLTSIILASTTFFYIMITLECLKPSIAIVVAIGIICILDLVITTFRVLDNWIVKILYKIFTLFLLMIFVLSTKFDPVAHLIAIAFIIITSLVNVFAFHGDKDEKYFLPFKSMFLSYYLISFVDDSYISLAFATQALLFAFIYRILSKGRGKSVYAILIGLSLLFMVSNLEKSLIVNVLAIVATFVSFYMFRGKTDDKVTYCLYGFLLFLFICLVSPETFIESLILLLVVGILTYIYRNKPVCFAASMFVLLLTIEEFISLTIKNYDICLILTSLMYLIMIGIAAEVLFSTNSKAKNVFAGIAIAFTFLSILGDSNSFISSIFALIAALSVILVSISKDGYKSLFYVGLVFGSLYLLQILSLVDGVPTSVYLIIISLVLIIIVSVMIYRGQNNKEIKAKDDELKISDEDNSSIDQINFCPECGSKIEQEHNYCSECGIRVR